ncbi:phytanoyl-CoA dioxygenase family protein [soil metagenome]
MTSALSAKEVEEYRAKGVHWPVRGISTEDAAHHAAAVVSFEKEYGDRARQILRQKSHLVLPWINQLTRTPNILDAVESLLGPDIFVWSSSFFIKDPYDKKFVSWHQDAPYWGLKPDDTVTAWVAFTPSNVENGCMRVVPGSQRAEVPHANKPNQDNLLLQGQEVAVEVDDETAANIELKPGEFSLHHSMIIHGSGPNQGSQRRVGFAIRYLKTSARQTVEASDSATLVRGTDAYGNFQHEPTPQADMHPDAVKYLDDLLTVRYGGRYRQKK